MKKFIGICVAMISILSAIDIQYGDKIPLDSTQHYKLMEMEQGTYVTNFCRSKQVIRIDGDNIEVLDREINDVMNPDLREAHSDTLLFPRMYHGIDVYACRDNDLQFLDTILDNQEPSTSYYWYGLDVMDDVLFQCHHVYPDESDYFTRWEVYSVRNLLEPELISSVDLPNDRIVHKAFSHNGHYYFVEYLDVVKMCDDLTTMDLQPATDDLEHFDYVWDAEYYDDHLFLTSYQGDYLSLFVYSFLEDGTLSLDSEFPLNYTVNASTIFDSGEIVYAGYSNIDDYSIIRFQWLNEELTNREDFYLDITGYTLNLAKCDDGYVGFTSSAIHRFDHDFQENTLISTSKTYWIQEIIMNRYLLMLAESEQDIFTSIYNIYDLETRSFLPFETRGWFTHYKKHYSNDSWIFEFSDHIEIVKLGNNGIESISSLSVPSNYITLDIYENTACLSEIVDSEVLYRFYRIDGDQLIYLNEFDPDYYTNTCMFIDAQHIVIIESYYYHPGYHYYRIEDDYSLTEIMFVSNEIEIYATESMIAPSGSGLCPLNFTDPDNPILLDALELPGYQYLGNYLVSYNGYSHFMYSDCYFNAYITDDQFNIMHHWQDLRCFFLDGNNIVLNDGSSLVLAEVNGLDSDDETTPMIPSSPLLHPNHPNPFNPETTIAFDLPERSHVRLEIYNIRGQKVDTLLDEMMDAGNHSVVWKPENIASGVYLSRLWTGKSDCVRKMILLK